jgi:uncharacterized protein (DUF362 family)
MLLFTGILVFGVTVMVAPGRYVSALAGERLSSGAAILPKVPVIYAADAGPVALPEAIISVIQSGREKAEQITFDEVLFMVRKAVADAGGLAPVCKNGDLVVLKPNLVSLPETWREEYVQANGKTTDWRVTRAVAMLVREINPDGEIYILEGSAMQTTREVMEKLNYDAVHIPEVDGILCLEEVSGGYGDLQSDSLVGVFLDPGSRKYPVELMPGGSLIYYLNRLYKEADVLISIPVLKNHDAASFTGSIKNVGIGATPQNIYGNSPADLGRWNIISHDPEELHQWIHDFYRCRPVDFVVVDGLQGMECGPTEREYQTGRKLHSLQKNMRVIMAGADPIATDAIAALMICQDPTLVNHLVYLHNSKLGTLDPSRIRVVGKQVDAVRKVFSHWSATTLSTMFTDMIPPEFAVNSFSNSGGDLSFNLSAGSDVVKVEIAVKGQILDQVVLSGFGDITLDLDTIHVDNENEVVFCAYDRFLNCSKKTAANENVTGAGPLHATATFQLAQNYPNPFKGMTTIPFHLSDEGRVRIAVYDTQGRECAILLDQFLLPGQHTITWDTGSLPRGIYLCCLEQGGALLSRRMIVE